jgi:chorismate dehydratase
MFKVRISAVRYSNTYPLIYGLENSGIRLNADIEIDHPAECARKLVEGKADIGLVPVAAIHANQSLSVISDFCIGSRGPVRTVLLLSNRPPVELTNIYLDYRSRTSVALTRVIARNFWKHDFKWIQTDRNFNFRDIADDEGLVLIGDQCYEMETNFRCRTDLASEWNRYTGLPFVFACWASNKSFSSSYLSRFNKALAYGVANIDSVVDHYGERGTMPAPVLRDYLTNNIDFFLDEEKRIAMKSFFTYLDDLKES